MDVSAYLSRLEYNDPIIPNARTLRMLQEAQLLTVPFENLSIHLDEPIVLDDEALFEKVVRRGRGGFCYELNGLFLALLRVLGFDVVMLSAAVGKADGTYTPYFDHMALMVTLEERWLVEVGFGDTFRQPLLMDNQEIQLQTDASYRIVHTEDCYVLMACKWGGEWEAQYKFRLEPYTYPDFAERCHFQQYSPDSHFRRGRVCSRITPDGRITLSEAGLTRSWLDGRSEEQKVENDEAFLRVLEEHFGIILPEPKWLQR